MDLEHQEQDIQRVNAILKVLEANMNSCSEQAQKIGAKKAQIQSDKDNAARKKKSCNDQINVSESKRKELKEAKKALFEAISKEMKGIDKKKLAKAIALAKSGDKCVTRILDGFAKFLEGKDNASFSNCGDKYTKNAEEFQQYVRAIKHTSVR